MRSACLSLAFPTEKQPTTQLLLTVIRRLSSIANISHLPVTRLVLISPSLVNDDFFRATRYTMLMRADLAIKELELLKEEAQHLNVVHESEGLSTWDGKVRVVLSGYFGDQDYLVTQQTSVSYCPAWVVGGDDSAYINARQSGIKECCSIIDAAIYKIRLELDDDDSVVTPTDYDPELWEHVKTLVQREEWDKVPAQVSIFVESKVREWAGTPTDKNGQRLIGKSLMAKVFGDNGQLRLGSQSNETEGWRSLAIGFTQAISNAVRHGVSERDDARQYAIGVLGLASLLFTEVRHEYGNTLTDK